LATLAVTRFERERRGILTDMSDLTEIRDASRTFIADREWQQFQDPKSILLALVGEIGELGAWVRNTLVGVLRRSGDCWETRVCLRIMGMTVSSR